MEQLPCVGFRPVNYTNDKPAAWEKGRKLFRANHVYEVEERRSQDFVKITGKVLSSMPETNLSYGVSLQLNQVSKDEWIYG